MGEVYLIDGSRIPFLRSGTDYQDLMSYQLGAMAIRGLINKTAIDPAIVDRVVLGTVVHNIRTANVAREAALTAGIPSTTPALTVSQACISANAAISHGADLIRTGQADVVIAGGTDCVSDIPISFPKKMRKKLFNAQKIRGFGDMLKFGLNLRPSDFKPDLPTISEFSTNRTMGEDCDLMAARYDVSREEQDQFAERSHQMAAKAEADGVLNEEISKAEFPPKFEAVVKDNTIRADTTAEKLSRLRPAFDKKHGTLTAGNSSFLTDGAAVVLLMSEAKMKELSITAKARVLDYVFTGQDPNEELLLGPAYATFKILNRLGLQIKDLDVFEYHEAFAAQILTNLKCIDSAQFASDKIGVDKKLGEIPIDKFNVHGGSLSLGHPFGATGARLMTTAANRLHREDGNLAIIAACAAGAHGHAMVLERV